MKFLRFMLAFVLAVALALPASAMTGNSNEPAHYLALGDSLAFGIDHNNGFAKGYTGELADMLEEDKLLASYNRGFAVPGYKTTDVLEDLEKNVEKAVTDSTEKVKIIDAIKQSDVITLTIGANDVLGSVKFNNDGTISFKQEEVMKAITTASQNIDQILKTISEINPTADVFVMGLYNPKPHLVTQKVLLDIFVDQVDSSIKKVTEANAYYFVPVQDVMEANAAEFLPNPANIHPSDAGYLAIAKEFYTPVKEYIGLIPLPEVIDPTPEKPKPTPLPDFKDVKPTNGDYAFIMQAAQKGILKGYSNGTFKPYNNVTRVQVTSMITRMMNLTDASRKVPYTDIGKLPKETQHEIALAYNAGLLKEGKKFSANTALTRLEFAQMVDAAYSHTFGKVYYPEEVAPFTDIKKLKKEEQRVITLLYDFEIASGLNNKFNPQGIVKRSQAAKMLVQLNGKFE